MLATRLVLAGVSGSTFSCQYCANVLLYVGQINEHSDSGICCGLNFCIMHIILCGSFVLIYIYPCNCE